MSASDYLQPRQFYHGTRHEFTPGDLVDPGREQNPDPSASGPYAYVSPDKSFASGYGKVYKVEPTGPVERVPHGASLEYQTAHPLRVTGEA